MYNELKQLRAQKIIIKGQQDLIQAGNHLLYIKDLENKIKAYWADAKDKAYKAHKEIVSKEKEMLEIVESKKAEIKSAIIEYDGQIKKIACDNGTINIAQTEKHHIVDEKKVIEYLAKNKLYECLKIDAKKLEEYINLLKKDIPGVSKETLTTMQIRGAK